MAKSTNKKLHTNVGDRVIVVSGKDKGKVSSLKKVIKAENNVVVEGANIVTKAQKAQYNKRLAM